MPAAALVVVLLLGFPRFLLALGAARRTHVRFTRSVASILCYVCLHVLQGCQQLHVAAGCRCCSLADKHYTGIDIAQAVCSGFRRHTHQRSSAPHVDVTRARC